MSSPSQTKASKSPSRSPRPEQDEDQGHRRKRVRTREDDKDETTAVETGESTSSTVNAYKEALKKSIDTNPPLPDEQPPLPSEPLPGTEGEKAEEQDDGWAPVWEQTAQAYYFYNRFTGASQWTNPRVPEPSEPADAMIPPAPGTESSSKVAITSNLNPPPPTAEALPAGGYNPAIHGDYDPNAWYAQTSSTTLPTTSVPHPESVPSAEYAATAAFNRFTGRFQNSEITPENYNDENKSKRQMNAFFDVDAAANSHEGKSLKAERSGKKLSKSELKGFKEKKRAKKEEKKRAWLKD